MESHDCCAIEDPTNSAPIKPMDAVADRSSLQTYRPLILIFLYLVGASFGAAYRTHDYSMQSWMSHFMGGFFVTFSFFKMLDLRGFATSYQSYDLITAAVPAYGYVYPFIELALGAAYVFNWFPTVTNIVTLVVMGESAAGVLRALARKQKIQCACLGTFFDLPMTSVTLFENALMVIMAAAMLLH